MTSRTRRTGYQERPSSWSEMADSAKQNREAGFWVDVIVFAGTATALAAVSICEVAWYLGWLL